MDEIRKELKSGGSFLDDIRSGAYDFDFGPIPVRLSLLVKLVSRLIGRRGQDLLGPRDAGVVPALNTLINFLVRRRRLSTFVGFPEVGTNGSKAPSHPMEWEALNDIASRHFQRLGICGKQLDANCAALDSGLSSVVSNHFRGVIKKATRE